MSDYSDLARIVTFRPLERPVATHGRLSPFKASWSSTVSLLLRELRAHGAHQTVLEIDLRESVAARRRGCRADRNARGPAIVLSFQAVSVAGEPHLRYEVGTFTRWQDNVRAIALGLEALRAVDRYGVTRRGEQYAGWKQLTTGDTLLRDRGAELITEHGGVTQALKATHPDHGGDATDFAAVQAARA